LGAQQLGATILVLPRLRLGAARQLKGRRRVAVSLDKVERIVMR
jgi:hypothetical protein